EFTAVPNTHYMHQARYSFVGDTGAGLRALRAGLSPRPHWPDNRPARTRAALAEAFPVDQAWGPAAVIETCRRVLPADVVATVDTGAHRILLNQIWRCPAPRTLLQSTALCTMGCALPLAIGRALAEPGRPVVAFTGDGGLEMVLGELATLRDLRLPVIVVVFDDSSLALIEMKQRNLGLANVGVDLGTSDFAAVARAMGGEGVTAGDRDALAGALDQALRRDGFTVIACPIDRRGYDDRF
ncbi:MAG: thiamine pyrophosphate-dependent enzyme, partial [Alphaproteobacteria bacterium]|nr:thiamine pyrophosphate-dependent enzyme [Alphaproteobacteria bacterium]